MEISSPRYHFRQRWPKQHLLERAKQHCIMQALSLHRALLVRWRLRVALLFIQPPGSITVSRHLIIIASYHPGIPPSLHPSVLPSQFLPVPLSQHLIIIASISPSLHLSILASQHPGILASHYPFILASHHPFIPASHHASITSHRPSILACRYPSISASRHHSIPASGFTRPQRRECSWHDLKDSDSDCLSVSRDFVYACETLNFMKAYMDVFACLFVSFHVSVYLTDQLLFFSL